MAPTDDIAAPVICSLFVVVSRGKPLLRISPTQDSVKSRQHLCQPLWLGKPGVCRLGCVQFTYTSVSARYIVLCTYVMLFMLSCRAWPDTRATRTRVRVYSRTPEFSLWSPPKDT